MRQLWTRAAVIALTAGTLAACESTGGAQYPIRGQAPTPNFPIVQAPVADQQPEGPSTPPPTSRRPTSPCPSAGPASPASPWRRRRPPSAFRRLRSPNIARRPRASRGGHLGRRSRRDDRRPAQDLQGQVRRQYRRHRAHPGHHPRRAGQGQRPEVALPDPSRPGAAGPRQQGRQGLCRPDRRHDVRHRQALLGLGRRPGRGERPEHRFGDPQGPEAAPAGRLQGQGSDQDHHHAVRRSRPGDQRAVGSTPSRRSARTPRRPPSRAVEDEPEAPAGRPVTTTTVSVTGPVVEVAGPRRTYTVKSGDAIDAIARGLDTTRADLAKDNDLEPRTASSPARS
jgi:hypothetical protein